MRSNMKTKTMTQLFFSAVLTTLIAFSCQKAAERPAKLKQDLDGNSFEIAQVQKQDQTPESVATLKAVIAKCISLVKDENQKKQLQTDNEKGLITVQLSEGKISLIRKNDAQESTEVTQATSETATVSETTVVSLTAKTKLTARQNRLAKKFVILKSFTITSGTLENERTDYNEKLSLLVISPKKLSESTHFSIVEEITTDAAIGSQISL